MSDVLGVGIVGCGNIAGRYVDDICRQPHLRLVGVTDADAARAEAFARECGATAFRDLDAMLADPSVHAVANLTSWQAHVPVTRRALDAGRDVFSEKPLAVRVRDARELLTLADRRGVTLAAAPIVGMGELAQTARRWIDSGRLGTVRLAYADVNWGRIERWHDAPEPFYAIGPLYDVGIYPVTLLTGLLGPVVRVTAHAAQLLPVRTTRAGDRFAIGAADAVVATLEHAGDAVSRITANFYVPDPARQRGVELHGDDGSVWLSNWFQFAGTLEVSLPSGAPARPVPLLRKPDVPIPWAAGLDELAVARAEGRPPRGVAGDHATHVVDVLETTLRAAEEGRALEIATRFAPPPPMDWAAELPLPELA